MNVYLYSPNKEANVADQWDFGLLNDLLIDYHIKHVLTIPKSKSAIVVIPARHNAEHITRINADIKNVDNLVLFLMGDEEAVFPVEKIKHDSVHIWVQNPHVGRHDKYNKIGTGYPMHMWECMPNSFSKDTTLFFAGQITHQRREELSESLEAIQKKDVIPTRVIRTEGFTQGVEPKEYYRYMCDSKIAPCPSGAVIPDSFRLFEALECMSIPIADERTSDGKIISYWDWLFGEITPFPKTNSWYKLEAIVDDITKEYPELLHKITAWWIMYKRNLKIKIEEQLNG